MSNCYRACYTPLFPWRVDYQYQLVQMHGTLWYFASRCPVNMY